MSIGPYITKALESVELSPLAVLSFLFMYHEFQLKIHTILVFNLTKNLGCNKTIHYVITIKPILQRGNYCTNPLLTQELFLLTSYTYLTMGF